MYGIECQAFPTIHGILSVEYYGVPPKVHDGICVTLLISISDKSGQLPVIDKTDDYDWHEIQNPGLMTTVKARTEEGMCVPLIDL